MIRGILIILTLVVGIPVGVFITVENSWFLSLAIGGSNFLLCMTLAKLTEVIKISDEILKFYYKEEAAKKNFIH